MIKKNDYSQTFWDTYILNSNYKKFYDISLGEDTIESFNAITGHNTWYDIFELKKKNLPLSCWNGTRIDYIYLVIPNIFKDLLNKCKQIQSKFDRKYGIDSAVTLYDNISDIKNLFSVYNTQINDFARLSKPLFNGAFKNINEVNDYLNELSTEVPKYTSPRDYFLNFSTPNDYKIQIYNKNDNIISIKDIIKSIADGINIIDKIKYISPVFSDASDHFPLFVDIMDPVANVPTHNKNLADLELRPNFIKNGYIELTSDELVKYWNIINNTTNTQDLFIVYNGQPGIMHDWFNFNSVVSDKHDFVDPFNFGTAKGNNSIGNIGVYGAISKERAASWADSFIDNGILQKKFGSDVNIAKIPVIFEFKLELQASPKIIYISKEKEWINYPTQFDNEYDIVVGEDFSELKITTKNYNSVTKTHSILKLNGKYIRETDVSDANTYLPYQIGSVSDNFAQLSSTPTLQTISGGYNTAFKKYNKYKNDYTMLKNMNS